MKNDPRSCERIFAVLTYDLFHIHLSHSSLTGTYEHIILTGCQHQWLHSLVGYSIAAVSQGHGFKSR